jgi:hypothetical protein
MEAGRPANTMPRDGDHPLPKEHKVKHRTTTSIATVLVLGLLLAGSALAGTLRSGATIAFTAKYAGTAVTKVTDDVADISATGTGKGTLIGAGKISGKATGDASQQPCVPFGGTGRMTGVALTTINFKVVSTSKGCGDESGQFFSLSGKAVVLKATGKLRNAKGTLKFTGTYNRATGAFTVKFFGSLVK